VSIFSLLFCFTLRLCLNLIALGVLLILALFGFLALLWLWKSLGLY